MILQIVFLIVGFVLLIKGADFLIDGAVALSRKFGVPEIVIGLTVIAFGTSLPELIVNGFASVANQSSVVYGNVVGSNICNILLILGVTGLIAPIKMAHNTVWKEIPFSLLAVVVLGALSLDGSLTKLDATVLLALFVIFLIYIFFIAKTGDLEADEVEGMSTMKMVIFMTLGFVGLIYGGKTVVDSAVKIAQSLGVSEKFIALTIVSIGTSLPELVASVVAARKGQPDLAIGNVVGSNIFNIFLIMGVSGAIGNISYDPRFNFDLSILLGATLLLITTAFIGKKNTIERWQAGLMLLGYIGYVGYSSLSM